MERPRRKPVDGACQAIDTARFTITSVLRKGNNLRGGAHLPTFLSDERERHEETLAAEAGRRLAARLARNRQVGDVLKLDYSEATIVVHDRLRREVGGLPLVCSPDYSHRSWFHPRSRPRGYFACIAACAWPLQLPNHADTDRDRFEAAKRAADRSEQWDDQTTTDQFTLNLLRFAGLRCRILGTFLLKPDDHRELETQLWSKYLANFYSGRGMKVYKPDGQTLADIVNFVRPYTEPRPGGVRRIQIGRVRYAASERSGDDTSATRVDLDPSYLLARRTALFGMSRTGKSNTTKIIAAAVFGLRDHQDGLRVGQLILDLSGEYANDNVQDAGSLRGVGAQTPGARPDDIVTYGLHPSTIQTAHHQQLHLWQ